MPTTFHNYFTPRRSVLLGCFFSIIAALFSSGFHHYDEQYHVIEYVALKMGITAPPDLPWELEARTRGWLMPGLFLGISKIAGWFGISNPLILAFLFRLSGALLNCGVLVMLARSIPREIGHRRLAIAMLSLLWFFPYIHARTSIENWSAALFFLGVAIHLRNRSELWVGLLWYLAFHIRVQMAPLIAGTIAWNIVFNRFDIIRRSLFFLGGALIGFLLAVLADSWGYGQLEVTSWNYLLDQWTHTRASNWGTAPPWYFLSEGFLRGGPPISILLVGGVLLSLITFPKSIWTWMTVPFLLLHTIEPHKEYRFLFPVLYAVPFQIALVADRIESTRFYNLLSSKPCFLSLVVINFLLLFWASLRPAEGRTRLFSYLQTHYPSGVIRYTEDDPYSLFKMPLNFYRPKNLTTRPITFDEIPLLQEKTVVVSPRFTLPDAASARCTRNYSVLPAWLSRFNFNQWIQRTRVWTVYECGGQ